MVTASRIVLIVICAMCVVVLLNRFRVNRNDWNPKTRDYWYALTMWTVAAGASNVEALYRHLEGRYSMVLAVAAAIVTLTGVLRKGGWGGLDNQKDKERDSTHA